MYVKVNLSAGKIFICSLNFVFIQHANHFNSASLVSIHSKQSDTLLQPKNEFTIEEGQVIRKKKKDFNGVIQNNNGNGKVIPITDHEGPWGMWMQRSTSTQPWH